MIKLVNNRKRIVFPILLCLLLSVCSTADTKPDLETEGIALYESEQYEEAISVLKQVLTNEPNNAAIHHVLAKSYGRRAEQINWFSAISYASKTREHLEIAVKIEPENVQYLDDMRDFYAKAPQVLGGDPKKAKAIDKRINELLKIRN